MTRRTALALAATCLAFLAGCHSAAPDNKTSGRLVPGYDKTTGRLTELKYDRNGDGKIDTWAAMDGPRLVRMEIDENGDGKPDRFEYYKAGPNGQAVLERVESAKAYDGRISRREFLEGGRLARIEEDTDGDGIVDKWERYKDDALVVMDLDTQRRGKPDRRLIYGPGGQLERIEVDADGRGEFRPMNEAR